MSQRKLTTQPCNPGLVSGRKILRNRDGHAVISIERPIRIFWTYDDGGENDPDLKIWMKPIESFGIGSWIYTSSNQAGTLNIPSLTTLYTCEDTAYSMFLTHYRLWAFLDDEGRSRGMTFWILGLKIHVTASFTDFVTTAPSYIGEVERIREGGQYTQNVRVNGVDRGPWAGTA